MSYQPLRPFRSSLVSTRTTKHVDGWNTITSPRAKVGGASKTLLARAQASGRQTNDSTASTSSSSSDQPPFILFNQPTRSKSHFGPMLPAAAGAAALAALISLDASGELSEQAMLSTGPAPLCYAILAAAGFVTAWGKRADFLSTYLSAATGLSIGVSKLQLCSSGVVLRGVAIGHRGSCDKGVCVGTVLVRSTLGDLWTSVQQALGGGTLRLPVVRCKDLRIATSRDTLLELLDRARAVGFSVDRLLVTNATMTFTSEGPNRGEPPCLKLHTLELQGLNHRMGPAEVAGCIVRLKEDSCQRAGNLMAAAVRAQRRLEGTLRRLERMDLHSAVMNILTELEALPEVSSGPFGPVLGPLMQAVQLQLVSQSPSPVRDVGRMVQRTVRRDVYSVGRWSQANLQSIQGSFSEGAQLLQELTNQGVVKAFLQHETRILRLVDALQPEGNLLPMFATRGKLLTTLVEQQYISRLIDQGMLDALLLRRELLRKLLDSNVLDSLVSTGVLQVLTKDGRSEILEAMVTGNAMEVLIDTKVLPRLLGVQLR